MPPWLVPVTRCGIPTERQQRQGKSAEKLSKCGNLSSSEGTHEENSNRGKESGTVLKLKRKIRILQPTDREQGKRISKQGPTDCKRDPESPARELLQQKSKRLRFPPN
jgi:hypothetical protein